MHREVALYNRLQNHRMRMNEYRQRPDPYRAALYINYAFDLASSLQIASFPVQPLFGDPMDFSSEEVLAKLYAIEAYVNALEAKHVYQLDGQLSNGHVVLDADWRALAGTYVQHIREVVRQAEIDVALREGILSKLIELQGELDRDRTRVSAATETLVLLCEAMGKGAKKLEPAVKLVERVAGALYGLQRREQEDDNQRRLPPPDTLGLPDLSADKKS